MGGWRHEFCTVPRWCHYVGFVVGLWQDHQVMIAEPVGPVPVPRCQGLAVSSVQALASSCSTTTTHTSSPTTTSLLVVALTTGGPYMAPAPNPWPKGGCGRDTARELVGCGVAPVRPDRRGTGSRIGPSDGVSVVDFPFGITGGGAFAIWTRGFLASEPEIDSMISRRSS